MTRATWRRARTRFGGGGRASGCRGYSGRIKGLGGYHLACDALNVEAVQRLRQRKQREDKPFAVMVPDLAMVQRLCDVGPEEAALLQSHRRPIVLLRQPVGCPVAPEVAPRQHTLGVMLPYTPLPLFVAGCLCQPARGHERPVALVMTSGNVSDEPIAYQDDEACTRLASIADGMLLHDREIHMRCDDSVTRIVAGAGADV